MTPVHPHKGCQQGSALVISIFFLLLLATLALTGLRASTTNVQIVGNMQARQEVTAAAQMLLEQTLSSDEFASNPQGVYAAARVDSDYNGDGVSDAVAVLAQAPVCLRARSVALVDLDPSNPQDAPCFASAALTNPGLLPGSGGPAGSLCADTEWHLRVRSTDAQTGASITLNQGVTLRTAVVGLNTVCN
jgi:hypothetical protein